MTCNEFHRMLEERRDACAPPSADLATHAAACAACAGSLAAEQRLAEGLAALRRAQSRLDVPAGFAARTRRLAASQGSPRPQRRGLHVAAGVALAAGIAAFAVLVSAPQQSRLTAAPVPSHDGGLAALPVLYSDGDVDIVGQLEPPPIPVGGDVLVEWNL